MKLEEFQKNTKKLIDFEGQKIRIIKCETFQDSLTPEEKNKKESWKKEEILATKLYLDDGTQILCGEKERGTLQALRFGLEEVKEGKPIDRWVITKVSSLTGNKYIILDITKED